MHDQQPIQSGFSAKSTAQDVMQGIDLSGKFAIVTGGYSGIGIETVRALLGAGADVLVPARRPDQARQALVDAGLAAKVAPFDLADLASVRNLGDTLNDEGRPVDLLINNAGIMANPETRIGPGWESQFAINHIGHFVFTDLLMPLLRSADGARVIALTSVAHHLSGIRFDDIHFQKSEYEKWPAYGQAKTANALFARELDKREADNGVKSFAVHPGCILTPLQRHMEEGELAAIGWLNEDGTPTEDAKTFLKTTEQGCATSLWGATSTELNNHGGQYLANCDIAALKGEDDDGEPFVCAHAASDEDAARLWDVTVEMLREA